MNFSKPGSNMTTYLILFTSIILSFCSEGLTVNKLSLKEISTANLTDVGSPLFLTPLIENGKIHEAKEKARVKHTDLKNIESYAGFFTVNKTINSNIFFWFFPSQNNSTSDPVILWLQGGPGSSSLYGLFNINGPFIVTKNNTLTSRKYSWTANHNVIYIDNPVGSGFSFTEHDSGYATNENDVGRNLYVALSQFFDLFPELRTNEFYATGESYAGKYIPAVAREIKNRNAKATKKINLVGLAIGNGWTDPINQVDYAEYLYQIGFLDDNGRDRMKVLSNNVKHLLRQGKYAEAARADALIIGSGTDQEFFKNLTGFDLYENYLYNAIDTDSSHYYSSWLAQTSVRKSLHVGNTDFNAFSDKVYNFLINDDYSSMASVVAELIPQYKLLIYTGQLDLNCPYPLVVNYLRQLKWPGAEEYKNAPRKQWRVGKELAGFSKTARNLTELLVRNAGHQVPTDQPEWAWHMITNFTRHQDL